MDESELLRRFRDLSLPKSDWTHRAHLRIGLAYLREYGPSIAMCRLREAIQRLNLEHGVVTTAQSGYHETRTRVWLCVLAHALAEPGATSEDIVERFAHHDVVLSHYRKETLESREARFGWVGPDLSPLPTDPGEWGPTPALFSYSL